MVMHAFRDCTWRCSIRLCRQHASTPSCATCCHYAYTPIILSLPACGEPLLQELLRGELAELLKLSGTSFKVELIMRLLGLVHARDTMIGSAMVCCCCCAGRCRPEACML